MDVNTGIIVTFLDMYINGPREGCIARLCHTIRLTGGGTLIDLGCWLSAVAVTPCSVSRKPPKNAQANNAAASTNAGLEIRVQRKV